MRNNNRVPIRVTINGPECEAVTPIIHSNADKEIHQDCRQALLDVVGQVIPASADDIKMFHNVWDQQLANIGQSETARYGIVLLQVGEDDSIITRPSFFVERNHKTHEIIADNIRFEIDRLASRFRRR